MVHFLFAISTH